MNKSPEALWLDFCTFAAAQVASGDLDPTYPVLRHRYAAQRLDEEAALWHTFLYVTWYNLHSTQAAIVAMPRMPRRPEALVDIRLPTGIERRGFRGNGLPVVHLAAVVRAAGAAGGLGAWLRGVLKDRSPEEGWAALRRELQKLPYCGPWASYKLADLLKNVHAFPITADDIGVGGGSETAGPVPGMSRLTGLAPKVCAGDVTAQRALYARCLGAGLPFSGLDQMETALCDFNSLCKGTYYCGHDIDMQQEHLAKCGPGLWEARAASFAPQWLGELSGWTGVRKELKTLYRDRGIVFVGGVP